MGMVDGVCLMIKAHIYKQNVKKDSEMVYLMDRWKKTERK